MLVDHPTLRRLLRALLAAGSIALASCGSGGSDTAAANGDSACELGAQRTWLAGYMADWYYFYSSMPSLNPADYASIESYFDALLAKKDDAGKDLDRWSYIEDSAAYNQFFGEGKSLGYGLFVAGQDSDPLPLRVRYIAPGSPADLAGLKRGMVIDRINGSDPADLKAVANFGALTPRAEGETLALMIRDGLAAPTARELTLVANVHALTPVTTTAVLTSAGGRKTGYLLYKDFISTSTGALSSALTSFQAAGVTELILDLRYNGGGLISVSRDLASALGGARLAGQRFATLVNNDRHQASNQVFNFTADLPALNLSRVYVLSGVRTCSASELVINGLKPFVDVVQIGATSCGKPFGFSPRAACGKTFSAINFESFNARDAGRYYDGIAPTCAEADDFEHALGDAAERLTAAALVHADSGICPAVTAASATRVASAQRSSGRRWVSDGDSPGRANMSTP